VSAVVKPSKVLQLTGRFCHVLDARKSGLKLRAPVKRKDDKMFGRQLAWRDWKKQIADDKGAIPCKRNAKLGSFIVGSIYLYRDRNTDR